MDIRKLISKFITQLCEKNYSEANKSLTQIVEAKTKKKVEKVVVKKKAIAKSPSKKEKEAFGGKGMKKAFGKKVTKKCNK